MRISFVLPYAGLQGGIRVIAIHAGHLARRGHAVRVISTPQVFSMRHSVKSLLLGTGLPRPEPSYFEGIDVPHRVLDCVRPVTDADVPDGDVVIATYYTTAEGVLRLSPSKGAKAIFIQNYEVEENRLNAALDASWRMPMHKIVISNWLLRLARERFGDAAVSHVPNGVDMRQFHAPVRGKNLRPTVGMLYSTFSLKGCATSLKAMERVVAAAPAVRLVCFGAEPPDFRLPLPRCAEFHYRPAQERLRDLYAQCDVWLCGSNVEGFHLPPLEAMACRCPVVSTRVGGPWDIVEEGVNGHLVEVKDERALAERVLRVLQLPDAEWRRMSDAAWRTATGFGWDEASDLFERALLRTIQRARREELVALPCSP
jgi:glycosyltransferase involved in cell wall biosynthesis